MIEFLTTSHSKTILILYIVIENFKTQADFIPKMQVFVPHSILWPLVRPIDCKRSIGNIHTDSKCLIAFGDWFWHLIGRNRSIVLDFYQQRPVFAQKIHPRPQRPKRPKKVIKGQNFKKPLILSIFNVKLSINGNEILRISCFSKIGNFHFHNIEFLKLHFVKNIKIAGFCW